MKSILLPILLLLTLTPGCGWIKRPVEATYCAKRSPDGKKCERWADHHNYPCVEDAYGHCTPSTK